MLARETAHGWRHATLVVARPDRGPLVGARRSAAGGAVAAGRRPAMASRWRPARRRTGRCGRLRRLARRQRGGVGSAAEAAVGGGRRPPRRVAGASMTAISASLGTVSPSWTRIGRERALERRRDLGVDLVGDDLDDRLVLVDVVADLLEPLPDGPLGDALAELGHRHRGHGLILLAGPLHRDRATGCLTVVSPIRGFRDTAKSQDGRAFEPAVLVSSPPARSVDVRSPGW